MAQLSKGIRVGYGAMSGSTRPSSYTFIPELTGIPALGASPSTHQATTLNDSMHVYIKGLIDAGGNLDFPALFTSDLIDAVDVAITAQESDTLEWCVEFPYPLGRRAYFIGEVGKAFNESVDVDAPVLGTMSLVPKGEITWEPAYYAITFDSNDGSSVATQEVVYNGLITEPADPTRDTYVFDGWYFDDVTFANPVNFDTYRVTDDVTLYAKWA